MQIVNKYRHLYTLKSEFHALDNQAAQVKIVE